MKTELLGGYSSPFFNSNVIIANGDNLLESFLYLPDPSAVSLSTENTFMA